MGFLISSLFVTNLYILFYNNILQFLNSHFPSSLPTQFIRIGASPEPFEIPIYIGLSFLFILLIYFVYLFVTKEVKSQEKKTISHKILRFGVLIFMIALLCANLGGYPMARSYFPYLTSETSFTYHISLFMYLLITLFLIGEAIILDRITRQKQIIVLLFFFVLSIVVAVVTFEPGFPMTGHDYSYFLGPIWEIAHGKTIYTEVPSQYGFVSILFFTLLYKLHLLNPFQLPVFIWLLYLAEYMGSFFLIYKVGKSLTLATISVISMITLNYFSIYHLPISIPQTGPLRFFPLILSLLLFYNFKRFNSKKLIFAISLLSLWVLDSGISLILAYLATLFLIFIFKKIDLKNAIRTGTYLLLSLISLFIALNLIHVLFGYKPIDIALVFSKLSEYGKAGFGMLPIDSLTYFWLVVFIYFSSIIYFIRHKEAKMPFLRQSPGPHLLGEAVEKNGIELHHQILLFSANLSLFGCAYFVGRSHPHNLFHIAPLPILNAFILLALIFKNQTMRFKTIGFFILFILFILVPVFNRQEAMTKTILEKYKYLSVGYLKPATLTLLEKKYESDAKLINKSIQDKRIVILSADDTYLFYITGKENLMNDNSQFTILTKNDVERSLNKVVSICPERIIADCGLHNKCENSNPPNRKAEPFTKIVGFSIQPLLLDTIQTKCATTYEPENCTQNICILKKKQRL